MSQPTDLPLVRAQAMQEMTVRWLWRGLGTVAVVEAFLIVLLLAVVLHLVGRLRNQDYLVISASGTQLVEPNTVSERYVANFAWDKAEDLVSVSNRTVIERYEALEPWLSADLEVHLAEAIRAEGPEYLTREWADAFAARRNDVTVDKKRVGGRVVWDVTIPGETTIYRAGLEMRRQTEIVTLRIAPQARIGPEQPNLLEVIDLWRRSPDAQARFDRARRAQALEQADGGAP